MQQIHPRISEENVAYLDGLADQSGLTRNQVLGMLLAKARELGWRVTPGETARVTYHMS